MSGSLLINQVGMSTVAVPIVTPKKHGSVAIRSELCKGCGLCVASCPKRVLALGTQINLLGYPSVRCTDNRCIGCGRCFYVCPEPGVLSIW